MKKTTRRAIVYGAVAWCVAHGPAWIERGRE